MNDIDEISLVEISNNEFNLDKFDALRLMKSGKKVIDINGYVYKWNDGIIRKKLAEDAYISSNVFIYGEINQFKEYIEPKEALKWGIGIDIPNANLNTILSGLNDIAILFHEINYEENRSKKFSVSVSFTMMGNE